MVDARRERVSRGRWGRAAGDELKILIYLGKFETIFQMVLDCVASGDINQYLMKKALHRVFLSVRLY